MRLYTFISIGFSLILLNSSLSFGASTYLFGDGSCSTLTGTTWRSLGKNCPTTLTHSLKGSENLFCQYRLKPGDTLKAVLFKNGFYRSKERVAVIDYSTGLASKTISSRIEYLLISKRDLLPKKGSTCNSPNPASLQKSAYALHIPNSLYVIKSGLKKINGEALFIEKEAPLATTQKKTEKKTQKKFTTANNSPSNNGVLSLTPVFFYENFKGTQISNGTTAEISSKLSPGVHALMEFRKNKNWQYSLFTGVDFHIFNEKAGLLDIANNNVQTIHFGTSVKSAHSKFFQPKLSAQILEDLYYSRQSSSTLGIERELVPRLSLSSEIFFYHSDFTSVSLSPTLIYDFAKGAFSEGIGYSAPLSFRFSKKTYSWGFDLNYLITEKDLDDLELERSVASLSLHMGFKL